MLNANVIRLPINADPDQQLERALGYFGPAQFVGWYADIKAYCTDGAMTISIPWEAYRSFVRHPYASRFLCAYDLGGLGEPAPFWLILDRETRHLSVARRHQASLLLEQQWPSHGKIEVFYVDSTQELVRLEEVRLQQVIEEQERHKLEQMEALEALRLWLELQMSKN